MVEPREQRRRRGRRCAPVALEVVGRRRRSDPDRGGVTVEAAMALAVLALVLVTCLAGIGCMVAQVRCADAAREAARLAGRGDNTGAAAAVTALAPAGATVTIESSGELVTVTVAAQPVGPLLPSVTIRASATAAREPGGRG